MAASHDNAQIFASHMLDSLQLMQGLFTSRKFKPHFHECYTIIMVNEGQGDYLNGHSEYMLSAGSILVLNPYDVHAGQAVEDQRWSFMTMYIPVKIMMDAARSLGVGGWYSPLFGKKLIRDSSLYDSGIALFGELVRNNEAAGMDMNHFLRRLIVAHSSGKGKVTLPEASPLQDVRRYIHQHYVGELPLKQLCSIAQMEDYTLVKSFRNHYQLPPHQYLINLRIERARELISTTALSLTEVGFRVGFFDQSHFIRHFKKIVGVTPTQFSRPYKTIRR